MTSAGAVTLRRVSFVCRTCRTRAHALDERLGVAGFVTPQARRLVCLAGASWSYDRGAQHLKEFCGVTVCDNTIRTVSQEEGRRARAWQRDDPDAAAAFRAAEGDVEFQTDGTSVNTTGGWREMRLSLFAKRERGRPVTDLDDWKERHLPAPHARVVTAAIRTSEALGPQWRRTAGRLGIARTADLTVLGDGAKWIWNQVEKNLPGAVGLLDIYHASEHIHPVAVTLHGEGTVAAQEWFTSHRKTLLDGGAQGLIARLRDEGTEAATPTQTASRDGLIAYLEPHAAHTAYRERLARGQAIGSGLVEGACKTLIGRRLKQTGHAGACAVWIGWRRCAVCSMASNGKPTGRRRRGSYQIPLLHPHGAKTLADPHNRR